MPESLKWWYEYHREDYAAVKDRLAACRNVMLRGRKESAARMMRLSCINAVLSIQTRRERHERAFTAYFAGDTSLETAAGMTVYGNQKAEWLHSSLAGFDFEGIVDVLRSGDSPRVHAAHADLVDTFKGLSWIKAAFALAMIGVWELACPDTRTKQVLDIEGRIRSREEFKDALQQIDQALDVDEPLFIKQWAMYDYKEGEHARHMPFYREILSY